jgi:hypothetical protein
VNGRRGPFEALDASWIKFVVMQVEMSSSGCPRAVEESGKKPVR